MSNHQTITHYQSICDDCLAELEATLNETDIDNDELEIDPEFDGTGYDEMAECDLCERLEFVLWSAILTRRIFPNGERTR